MIRVLRLAAALLPLVFANAALAAPLLSTQTTNGAVTGIMEGSVAAYLGVPYAAPPIGENRWRAPKPTAAWDGVRKADHYAASCMQVVSPSGFGPWTTEYVVRGKVSEDCLYLNIWTQAESTGQKLPVLFWIHGGAFQQGGGSVPIYDGAALAAHGIVVVDINYRLGALGFLAHPELSAESPNHVSGNYGLLDMVAALHWVRENIAAFGGDPSAVTIAGQSAGAASVVGLDVSPLSKGLYARAIAQSGAGLDFSTKSLSEAEAAGLQYAKSKGAQTLAALRAMPADAFVQQGAEAPTFIPIVDGWFMPDKPETLLAEGRFHDTPFMTGLVADENSAMGLNYATMMPADCDSFFSRNFGTSAETFRRAYPGAGAYCGGSVKDLLRDSGLASTAFWAATRLKTSREPVFLYFYDHPEPGPQSARYGAFHSSEIPYVFETLDKSPERGFTDKDRAISAAVSAYWLNFVKTGSPNGPGLPQWPAFGLSTKEIMELGDALKARAILDPAKLKMMEDYAASGGRTAIF